MKTRRLRRIHEEEAYFVNEHEQKEKQQKLQHKINMRFFVLFGIFMALILVIVSRLYQVQVEQHELYLQKAISKFDETRLELPTRGDIVDKKGKLLVSHEERLSLIYLEPKNESHQEKWEKAVKFVEVFDTEIDTMTHRDKQDAYIFLKDDDADFLITEDEQAQYAQKLLTDRDIYQLKLSRITPSLIEQDLTELELKQFYVYAKMQGRIGLDIVLKEEVTPEQINILLENPQDFSGIEVYLNWDRTVAGENTLMPMIGDITTNRQGLLRDNATAMQALDYKLNDRIGRSGLEQQYESILAGIRTKYSFSYSSDGLALLSEVSPGRKGDTLELSIDTAYQEGIEEIVKNFIEVNAYTYTKEYFNQMYVVVSNPNNGDVLATVGVQKDKEGNIHYIPSGTYLNAFMVGSSIKGSVVYLALNEGIFAPGELVMDEPIKIQGTPLKASYVNLGLVDDLKALSHSSNVYMFKTAMALGKAHYEYDKPLNIDTSAFSEIRSNFSMFGLGVETGLDVPKEETGYKSPSLVPGLLLDYVIGQYDSYTPMQLNQYVATIANGEYRYKLRLATQSYDTETGLINYQNPVTILNSIDNHYAMERVQQGFRLCVTNGYCAYLNDALIEPAAKTGSAETLYWDGDRHTNVETTTNTLVAYAPYNNPTMAISCVAPHYINTETAREYIPNGCEQVVKEVINFHAQFTQP